MTDTLHPEEHAERPEPAEPDSHEVTVKVNNKPVTVTGPRLTGLEIKEAAVSQGVDIEVDFQLAEVTEKGRVIIGNAELITVNKHSRFIATAPDDNS
jgi:hypothetical protein